MPKNEVTSVNEVISVKDFSMHEVKPAKYRKKPVVIEARRILMPQEVKTLEGTLSAKAGDWIITGVKGEQYPCDNEIFRATYERVEDSHD